MMNFKPRTLVALVAIAIPALSGAQVVPPPKAPGASAPASGYAQMVIAPEAVASANPAAATPAATPTAATAPVSPAALIDIALPDAPKKELVDLKPAPPVAAIDKKATTKPTTSKKSSKVDEKEKEAPAKPLDPFAGLVGTPVSDSQLNRFTFPEPVSGIYFSEGAPLPECPANAGPNDPCKPVFLNGKRMMLLQLRAGAKGPIQMLVHLESGRVLDMNLMPAAGPAAVIRVEGAEDGASDSRLAAAAKAKATQGNGDVLTDSEKNVALLSRFAAGDIPAGFEAVAVGPMVRFEHFDVIPAATWDNGANLRAHLFQVRAHGDTPVRISASLFRSPNVRAMALDRDTITNAEPAMLYMLEFVPTEGQ